MTADASLLDAYEAWRELAETEGAAIRASHWTLVAHCQESLSQLQLRITPLAEAARAEWRRLGPEGARKEAICRNLVSELIDLERRNGTLLQAMSQATGAQLAQLDQASHNLRRIQRSYAPDRAAAWTSFS